MSDCECVSHVDALIRSGAEVDEQIESGVSVDYAVGVQVGLRMALLVVRDKSQENNGHERK